MTIAFAQVACGEHSAATTPTAGTTEQTLRDYANALERLDAQLSRSSDAAGQRYATVPDSDAVNREFYASLETAVRDYAQGVAQLSPPPSLSDLNAQLVNRSRLVVDQVKTVRATIGHEQAQSVEEVMAGLKRAVDSFVAVQEACRQIQLPLRREVGQSFNLLCDTLYGSHFLIAP